MPSYDPTLFNVDPYYDDFSEDKKFLRLMFRPGYGVQARELTQLQTVLQNQIERLGSHIFEEGSMVLNGQISENRLKYARISANTSNVSDYVGVVMSKPGRPSLRVVHIEQGGSLSADSNPVMFFEYLEGIPNGGTGLAFNDVIAGTAGNGAGITATVTGPSVFTNPVGDGIVVSVDRGVRYVEGYFVLNTEQSIGAYSLSGSSPNQIRIFDDPTTRIGFNVNKEFVSSTLDPSLNDPAFGYYNYAAPGSDRFVIDLQLTQYGYTANDTTAVDNFSRVGFVEFMRIVDGDVAKVEKYPDYAALEDTLARRTYDESGNYTVSAFDLELKGPTTVNGTEVIKAELGVGKAYVFGYEFETQSKTRLNIACARGLPHERTVTRNFVRYVGPSTKVVFSGIGGSIGITTDFNRHPIALLSSGESGSAYEHLGTARLRGVETFSSRVYDLGIYDINMVTGSFDDVRRIYIGQTATHAFVLTGDAGLEDESQSSLLYRVPEGSAVKDFINGDFAVVTHHKQTVSTALPYQFTLSESRGNMQVTPSIPDIITLPNADVIVFDEDGKVCGGTAARSANGKELSVTITDGTTGGKQLHIIHTREPIFDSDAMQVGPPDGSIGFVRSKIDTTENITLTGAFASLTGDGRGTTSDTLYFNGLVDVRQVLALTGSYGASANVSVLSFFVFDDGQRDSFYDWSRMTLIDGITGVSGPFTATVRRYERDSYAGFFTLASYPNYEDIPPYKSRTTGEIYALRDCLDFRPDRSTNGDTAPYTWIPANTSANDNTYTYTHHLARTDKIVLTRDRKFAVIQGIPSVNGDIPDDDPNAMSLYTVRLNPYTFTNEDAAVRLVENKRYTMRDIGNLEKRIEAVEYYTTLNLLEQDAKTKSIRDENGIEMPKRGILVDQFKGHAVADNEDPMFSASVDEKNNEVRPAFDTRSYDFDLTFLTNITGNAEDGVYTLSFMESPEIVNLLAGGWQYVNPFAVTNYMGTMSLSPSTDKWFDDKSPPKIKVNVEGENDNFRRRKSDVLIICPGCPDNAEYARRRREEYRRRTWGASYNNWETRWFGTQNQNNKNNRPNVERTGPIPALPTGLNRGSGSINASNMPETINTTLGNRTIRKDVTARARERSIVVHAKGLKPNTPFSVFCDEMDVTPFCTGSFATSDELPPRPKTNFKGEADLIYLFNAPINPEVLGITGGYTGPEQDFYVGKHTIRISDRATAEESSMAAEAIYAAEAITDLTVNIGQLSTRMAQTRRKSVKSERIVSNLNEVMTTSGLIRGHAEPLSQTIYIDPNKYPAGVFVKSVDLYFKNKEVLETIPVIVQIRPTLSGYPHPSKVLPFATSVVYSGDNIQTQDMITSGAVGNTNFSFSTPVYLLPDQEYAVCISSNSPNFAVFTGEIGNTIITESEENPKIAITKQPFVRSLFKPQNTGKIAKTDNESLVFRLNMCKFMGSGYLEAQNAAITDETTSLITNEFRLNVAEVLPEGTTLTYSSDYQNGVSTYRYPSLAPNKNTLVVGGYHQSISSGSSLNAGSVMPNLRVNFGRNSNEHVSPVFDLERSSLITVTNIINNNFITDPQQNIELYNGELEPTNVASKQKALSRYITKRVTLEEGMEAENVTITLSLCNSRGSATVTPSIKIFARPIPLGESDIDNVGYVELTTNDNGESKSDTDFREVTFTNIGSKTLPRFRTFSVKILMLGDPLGSSVPKIRNLRIIAT
jgi:hypothetical protein